MEEYKIHQNKILLVTANIASCFEQPESMLNPWLDEFFKVVESQSPEFIALHCQEVGGKNYETSMEYVEEFLRNLQKRILTLRYTRSRIYLDEEFIAPDKFTALGNLYFIKDNVEKVQMWDFQGDFYSPVEGVEEYVGEIEDVSTKEKSKFPQQFFPECKWSRKGFMRTRWNINDTELDLVNIHLFHDASNFVAMENYPSAYVENRKRALEHTLDRFHNDRFSNVPMFLFGDFNFRLDTGAIIKQLTSGCMKEETVLENGLVRSSYKTQNDSTVILNISQKSFDHINHHTEFSKENGRWLQPYDKEVLHFNSRLSEMEISFPPTYPFEEPGSNGVEKISGEHYQKTRCPAWCDRVIFSHSAKLLLEKSNKISKPIYNTMGLQNVMGDHKPVYLVTSIASRKGIVKCCSSENRCLNFVHLIDASCFVNGFWCHCQSYPTCPGSLVNTSISAVFESNMHPNINPMVERSLSKEEAAEDSTVVKRDPSRSHVHNSQCVCSVQFAGENLADSLKNRFYLDDDNEQSLLKRVHSDPVKVRGIVTMKEKSLPHSGLTYSQSLDNKNSSDGKIRLRFDSTSSRLASHHSSSSEEWFEEVPPVDVTVSSPTQDIQDGERSNDTYLLETRKYAKQDNSMNNLLLADSVNYTLEETNSIATISMMTDNSSLRLGPNDRKKEPPNSKKMDSVSDAFSSSSNDNQSKTVVVESDSNDCCCSLS